MKNIKILKPLAIVCSLLLLPAMSMEKEMNFDAETCGTDKGVLIKRLSIQEGSYTKPHN